MGKKLLISIVLIVFLVGSLVTGSLAFGEERTCTKNRICVFPGDFLTYLDSQDEEISYIFEEFIDSDRIRFLHSSYIDGETYDEKFILDLQTGDTFEIDNLNEKYGFLQMIYPIPVELDTSSLDVDEEIFNFNNMKRYVWVANFVVEGGSGKIVLDQETGIILEIILKSESEDQSNNLETFNTLVYTNIIDVSTKIQFEKAIPKNAPTSSPSRSFGTIGGSSTISGIIPSEETVPDWIRSTALWWSEDLISDDEFVNGIQYLINEEIIQISAKSKSSEPTLPVVPSWIKDTAGWWGTNQVSDSDFINGIKWLIENGILIV